jgi:uncharacterized protein (TIGR03085 family)
MSIDLDERSPVDQASQGSPTFPLSPPAPVCQAHPVTAWVREERALLCDLLLEVGPSAPTLCEGWDTADLAAHLVTREGRPDAAAGLAVKPLAGWTDHVRRDYRTRPWRELVGRLRHGPPAWSPLGWPPLEAVNTTEFFVHHEDVRRARPGWEPRELPPGLDAALWAGLASRARLLFRRAPVGVRLRRDTGDTVLAGRGAPEVTLTGPAAELVLYAAGRRTHARVQVSGEPAATEALARTPLGF